MQPFVLFAMTHSLVWVDVTVNTEECRTRPVALDWTFRLLLLNKPAIRQPAALNGEGISAKCPRISADGAMPTI